MDHLGIFQTFFIFFAIFSKFVKTKNSIESDFRRSNVRPNDDFLGWSIFSKFGMWAYVYVGLWTIRYLLYFLFWNFNWNWDWGWDWSWNDLRECQKLWGGLCILYCSYRGGFAPRISTVQNTQASPEFLILPQVIPTSIPIPIPIPIKIPK